MIKLSVPTRIFLATVAMASVVGLAGCSNYVPESIPTVTVTVTATPAPVFPAMPIQVYPAVGTISGAVADSDSTFACADGTQTIIIPAAHSVEYDGTMITFRNDVLPSQNPEVGLLIPQLDAQLSFTGNMNIGVLAVIVESSDGYVLDNQYYAEPDPERVVNFSAEMAQSGIQMYPLDFVTGENYIAQFRLCVAAG